MTHLVDMHMHAGFADDPATFAHALADAGIASFANTVTPGEYTHLSPILTDIPTMRLGLGLHPWWVDTPELGTLDDALDTFQTQLSGTRFVGEVGLDFWPTRASTKDAQMRAFTRIMTLCAARGDVLVSMHSVKAERELLDVLEDSGCLERCTCILHSYGGPSDQLARAIEDGCLFSVGTRMLSTKRGREYARIIPEERLLVESDLPAAADEPTSTCDVVRSLESVLDGLARIRDIDLACLRESIDVRSRSLLGL